jgi:hypothetical protein
MLGEKNHKTLTKKKAAHRVLSLTFSENRKAGRTRMQD